ncbi:glycosyltransferase [Tardiphaga sp.]|jgi:glycosyltransferase involved in cell wall biosynthesis|uniref:glycosyltransferase n=1 Tax=Tardiphaga sp. TaxID=1926292 RepID=UPI0037DA2856
MGKPAVTIVVPVYNSVESLPLLVSRAAHALDPLAQWQVIFVDDRSPNLKTWPCLSKLTETYSNVGAVRLLKNRGRAAAAFCGISHVCSLNSDAVVVVMDDDLQHDPADIPRMLAALEDDPEADVVLAQFAVKEHTALARMGSWLKSRIDRYYYGLPSDIQLTSFVALKPRVAAALDCMQPSFPLFGAQLLKVAGSFRGLACVHGLRHDGAVTFTFRKRLSLFARILFSDTIMILRLFAYAGMIIATTALLVGVFFAAHKLVSNQTLVGWTSLLVTTILLGGLNMFLCGLIGINIVRTKENVERLPAWIEREAVGIAASHYREMNGVYSQGQNS